ncbi:MAG: type II toxin-antitoxin system RelE/ParE family toxin [Firmicutes bacterium]|nr:type II toxin-antitoxin system RelE/ParE family toxin [Bacillota bacterium]
MKYVLDIPAIIYRDISGICDYIAKDKPSAAKNMAKKLFRTIGRLKDNPFVYPELKNKFDIETDLRASFLSKPYIVLFKIDGNLIKIYRVLDGRSDYLAVLGLKESMDIENVGNDEN